MRYHKKIYFPEDSQAKLKELTCRLNVMRWRYTRHSLDNIKNRAGLEPVLIFIKGLTLQASDIFEYYAGDKGDIIKVCFRLPYIAGEDIILILGTNKQIITIYYNDSEDNHITLKKELYVNK